ncbi:MAG: hypothetical protein ACLUJS_15230 [Anaerostipes hadrus]
MQIPDIYLPMYHRNQFFLARSEKFKNGKQDAAEEEMIEALKISCAWNFVKNMEEAFIPRLESEDEDFGRTGTKNCDCKSCLRDAPVYC